MGKIKKVLFRILPATLATVLLVQPVFAGGSGTCVVGDTVVYEVKSSSTMSGYSNYTEDRGTGYSDVGGNHTTSTPSVSFDDIPEEIRKILEDPSIASGNTDQPDKPDPTQWLNQIDDETVNPDVSEQPEIPENRGGVYPDYVIDPETGEIQVPEMPNSPEFNQILQELMALANSKNALYAEYQQEIADAENQAAEIIAYLESLMEEDQTEDKKEELRNRDKDETENIEDQYKQLLEELDEKAEMLTEQQRQEYERRKQILQTMLEKIHALHERYEQVVKQQNDFDADENAEGSLANKHKQDAENAYKANQDEIKQAAENQMQHFIEESEYNNAKAVLFCGFDENGDYLYKEVTETNYDIRNNPQSQVFQSSSPEDAEEYLQNHTRDEGEDIDKYNRYGDIVHDFTVNPDGTFTADLEDGYGIREEDGQYVLYKDQEPEIAPHNGYVEKVQGTDGIYVAARTDTEKTIESFNEYAEKQNSPFHAVLTEDGQMEVYNIYTNEPAEWVEDNQGLHVYNQEFDINVAIASLIATNKHADAQQAEQWMSNLTNGMRSAGLSEEEINEIVQTGLDFNTEKAINLTDHMKDMDLSTQSKLASLLDSGNYDLYALADEFGISMYDISEAIQYTGQADEDGYIYVGPAVEPNADWMTQHENDTDEEFATAVFNSFFEDADGHPYILQKEDDGSYTALFDGVTFAYSLEDDGKISYKRTTLPAMSMHMKNPVENYYTYDTVDSFDIQDLAFYEEEPVHGYQIIRNDEGVPTAILDENGNEVTWTMDTNNGFERHVTILSDPKEFVGTSDAIAYCEKPGIFGNNNQYEFKDNKSENTLNNEINQRDAYAKSYDMNLYQTIPEMQAIMECYGGLYMGNGTEEGALGDNPFKVIGTLVDQDATDENGNYLDHGDMNYMDMLLLTMLNNFGELDPTGFNQTEMIETQLLYALEKFDQETGYNLYDQIANAEIANMNDITYNMLEGMNAMATLMYNLSSDPQNNSSLINSINDLLGLPSSHYISEADRDRYIQQITDNLAKDNTLSLFKENTDADDQLLEEFIDWMFNRDILEDRTEHGAPYTFDDLDIDFTQAPEGTGDDGKEERIDQYKKVTDETNDIAHNAEAQLLEEQIFIMERNVTEYENLLEELVNRWFEQNTADEGTYEDLVNHIGDDDDPDNPYHITNPTANNDDILAQIQQQLDLKEQRLSQIQEIYEEELAKLNQEIERIRQQVQAWIDANPDSTSDFPWDQIISGDNPYIKNPSDPANSNPDPQYPDSLDFPDYPSDRTPGDRPTGTSGNGKTAIEILEELLGTPAVNTTGGINKTGSKETITYTYNVGEYQLKRVVNRKSIRTLDTQILKEITLSGNYEWRIYYTNVPGSLYNNGFRSVSGFSVQSITFTDPGTYQIKCYGNRATQQIVKYEYVETVTWELAKSGKTIYSSTTNGKIGSNGTNIATSINTYNQKSELIDSWTQTVVENQVGAFPANDIDSGTIRIR